MARPLRGIKNLLFDQGGVIVDLDRNRCLSSLKALGMEHPEQMIGLYLQSGPFQALEAGQLSVDEFHEAVMPYFPAGVTTEQIDAAFSSFIVGIPEHRLRALRALKRHYRTFILSNTNPIMFNGVLAREFGREGLDVHAYFDGITVSYEAGYNKPARGIFDYAVATMHIVPEETLFLDDAQENLDAAAALGFHTLLVEPDSEFMQLIEALENRE